MACHCRTAALRLFVRGFAQLHISQPAQAATLLHQRVRPGPRAFQTSTRRNIHSSTPCREAATKIAAAAEAPEPPSPAHEESGTERQQGDEEAGNAYSAISELTPEAIAALASELSSAPSLKSAPEVYGDSYAPDSSEPQDHSTGHSAGDRKRRGKDSDQRDKKEDTTASAKYEDAMHAQNARTDRRPAWQIQKEAVKAKLNGEAWNPRKRLSPDALAGIRALHDQFPQVFTTAVLAEKFKISPEAVRRILKSRWQPNQEEEEEREERWFNRGKKIWERNAELGMRVPRGWRNVGVKNKRRPRIKNRNPEGVDSPYR